MAGSRRTHPVTIAFLGHVPNMRPLAHQASRCESENHFKGALLNAGQLLQSLVGGFDLIWIIRRQHGK
jgi:hypothetical protein